LNDAFKGRVNSQLESVAVEHAAHAFGDVEAVEEKHGTFLWRPPQDGVVFTVPRKYAVFIGRNQPSFCQVSSNGEQAFPSLLNGREGKGLVQQGDFWSVLHRDEVNRSSGFGYANVGAKWKKPDFCPMQSPAYDVAESLRKVFHVHGANFSRETDERMPFVLPTPEAAEAQGVKLRHAAVVLPVFPIDGKWHVALMKRTEYPGVHSGQISIPGGEVEQEDVDRFDTAMREFEEEMGVNLRQSNVVSGLSERFIPPSRFVVTAFVACLDHQPHWKVDSTEVAAVLTVPVEALLAPDALQPHSIEVKPGVKVALPAYAWEGEVIWGATAIMLTEFALAWREAVERA
jgi:8-oxo-dGTP pyrophosphatase MutT (NUDIX family)